MKIRDFGEFPFLRRLRHRVPSDARVQLGVGDDCAALSLSGTTLLTTDALVEGVHFRCEWMPFAVLGEKACAVNVSDIAAMGGEPTFALLSLGVPQETEVEDLDAFFDGFVHAVGAYGATLIGGNMSAAPCLMICVTLLGRAPYKIITRSGACVGDDIYVTGTLGDAALGLHALQEGRSGLHLDGVKARFLRPTIRLGVSREIAAHHLASAMIDVSDGLLQDLGHLCEESQVGAVIDVSALPLSPEYQALIGVQNWNAALTGGEDYELLFSTAEEHRAAVAQIAQSSGCAITRIGRIMPYSDGLSVRGPDGSAYVPGRVGYDHFRQG